mgnify:CR=1 FL=1
MKIGSCFSGVGAMDLAAERHFGGRTVWFCEQDQHCVKVLARHWPGVPVYGDVRTLVADGAEPIDVLVGGPPCQDMSAAGRQAGLVDGERSSLFFDFVDVAAALKPRLVIVENVPALLSKWRGVVEDAFAAAGYGCTWARVAAQHVRGCPHKRLRVFILATRGGPHRGVCDAGALPEIGAAWSTPLSREWKDGAYTPNVDINTLSRECVAPAGASPVKAQAWSTPTTGWDGDNGQVALERKGSVSAILLGQQVSLRSAAAPGAVVGAAWPTPNAGGFNDGQSVGDWQVRRARLVAANGGGMTQPPLAVAVKSAWPTPRAAEPGNGRRNRTNEQYAKKSGATLRESVQPQAWPTPAAGLPNDGQDPATYRARLARLKAQHNNGNGAGVVLAQAVQPWATPASADDRDRGDVMNTPAVQRRVGVKQLNLSMQAGGRLNPAWVEALQGLPPGWSDPTGSNELRWHAEHLMDMPRWPAPMVKGMWGDSPQHAWEPPRAVSVRVAARSARLRALGNCNPPQQYLLAFALLERGPAQVSLFELMA